MIRLCIEQLNRRRHIRDRQNVKAAALRYLDSRHYTLYADFDISRPERKAEAAEWLTKQILEVLEEMGR